MVMVVFTLPSFPYVFKVIRDWFPPPKDTDRASVEAKYEFVKLHDRVGRMATRSSSRTSRSRSRARPDLLEELELVAAVDPRARRRRPSSIRHLYIERRLTPLNLYLAQRRRDAGRDARSIEYGKALKELAGANIFPGDLLLKNFGVTRYGRVVFYDYDELCELTDCRFRAVPQSRTTTTRWPPILVQRREERRLPRAVEEFSCWGTTASALPS